MPYYRVPIVGTGTRLNPYRPAVAGFVRRWSAHIPSNANGTPRFVDCYVWVPPGVTVPVQFETSLRDRDTARSDIRSRDSRADPDVMENTR